MTPTSHGIIVIGAGIGGLTAAALLAKAGFRVTVLEAQTYPGGCASTYYHKGFRFDSGATVMGGFQPGGPHAIVSEMLAIDWPVHPHDPAWITHLPDRSTALTADKTDVLAKFPGTEKFWQQQRQLAEIAWQLAAQRLPWPPRSRAELRHLLKIGCLSLPHSLKTVPLAFTTVRQWLRWNGLHTNRAFVRFLDAQLLISAQATSEHANALYAATALDLTRQGVYHVEGGSGSIAQALVSRIESLGGQVLYRQRVTRIEVNRGRAVGVYVRAGRQGSKDRFYPCKFVIANTTPWDVCQLLGENSPASLRREVSRRQRGWGAFVLHMGVHSKVVPPGFADHHQVITEMEGSLGETRSIFISISLGWDTTRAPEGQRAVTVTTHTRVQQWWDLLNRDEIAYHALKAEYTDCITSSIDRLLPGFRENLSLVLPGTPVTYNFYTARHRGMVGGFPQTSLLTMRGPRVGIPNVRLVGDSIFPGQSTAGVTLGALRVTEDVLHNLPRGIAWNEASSRPVANRTSNGRTIRDTAS
jgi:C-3',4' desaturase CrtD